SDGHQQENCNHAETHWVRLANHDGIGSMASAVGATGRKSAVEQIEERQAEEGGNGELIESEQAVERWAGAGQPDAWMTESVQTEEGRPGFVKNGTDQPWSGQAESTFDFGATYYEITDLENASHTIDLKEREHSVLHVDTKQDGLGSNPCAQNQLQNHRCTFEPF